LSDTHMHDENPYASPSAVGTKAGDGNTVIRVTRTKSYADRIRAYRVLVDGQEAARINAGQTVEIPVDAGAHSVVAKLDWCGSPTLHCDVHEGETVELECGSNLRGLRIFLGLLYVLFLRDSYLTLVQR